MMEPTDLRSTIGQLADDLRWLEEHCRRQPELAAHAGTLCLASALTRNVVGPFLEGQPARPLHIAVVGGAGTGKSTVVNFLVGSVVAEANPQAGYTRHPTAFVAADPTVAWPTYIGFLGPLIRLSGDKPANTDEDVYQLKRVPVTTGQDNLLGSFVVWDCPDMTTWSSAVYVRRLLEVAALADVIVYVASDERYNDEVPTQFLHTLIKAGKAVVVVLTKVRESDAAALADHFKREVLGRLPKWPDGTSPAVPVVTFPQMSLAERTDPAGAGSRYRVLLLDHVLKQCESETALRLQTVTNATKYLTTAADGLLDVARRDLAELENWRSAVLAGKAEFEERYRREFLSGEPFRRFDRFRDEVLNQLELPGAGRLMSGFLWVCRLPYYWLRDSVIRWVSRPQFFNLSEHTVLTASLVGWLDKLQAEALRRSDTHPIWKQLSARFDAELAPQVRDRFNRELRSYELKELNELEEAGQRLVGRLTKNPALLYTLRAGKLALDLGVVAGVIYYTWPPGWSLLLIPLGVSLTHQATELAVNAVVERVRGRVRDQRVHLVSETLSTPLADWLVEWPTTGGSRIGQLRQLLRRVPETIRQLAERVQTRASEWAASGSPAPSGTSGLSGSPGSSDSPGPTSPSVVTPLPEHT